MSNNQLILGNSTVLNASQLFSDKDIDKLRITLSLA
jgi:hypothetical protein